MRTQKWDRKMPSTFLGNQSEWTMTLGEMIVDVIKWINENDNPKDGWMYVETSRIVYDMLIQNGQLPEELNDVHFDLSHRNQSVRKMICFYLYYGVGSNNHQIIYHGDEEEVVSYRRKEVARIEIENHWGYQLSKEEAEHQATGKDF